MKVNYLITHISLLLAYQSHASTHLQNIDPPDDSHIEQNKNSIIKHNQALQAIASSDSYDVSKVGPCEVCRKLSSTICPKCKKAFYCSTKCQKKEYEDHKLICHNYYHNEQNILARNEYNTFLDSYDSLSCLQYYPKSSQLECVDCYLRQLEERYDSIMSQDLKFFIFLMVYDPPQDREFKHLLTTSLQVDDSGHCSLSLNNKNPMYLIRFLQYIYQRESSKQVVDKRIKKCLFQKIAHVNWILGALFCFPLQRKLVIALIKVMPKEDYEMLREISIMGYSEMNSSTRYYPCEIDGFCIFYFMLKQGEKKALKYASVRGWYNLMREVEIGDKEFLRFCSRTPHARYTCCSNTLLGVL